MTIHSIAGEDVDASFIKQMTENGRLQHGDNFDPSGLEAAAHFAPYYDNGLRLRVRTTYAWGEHYERTGTVGKTTGWKPAFLLMHRSNDSGSSDVLGANDEIVASWNGRRYETVRTAAQWATAAEDELKDTLLTIQDQLTEGAS